MCKTRVWSLNLLALRWERIVNANRALATRIDEPWSSDPSRVALSESKWRVKWLRWLLLAVPKPRGQISINLFRMLWAKCSYMRFSYQTGNVYSYIGVNWSVERKRSDNYDLTFIDNYEIINIYISRNNLHTLYKILTNYFCYYTYRMYTHTYIR